MKFFNIKESTLDYYYCFKIKNMKPEKLSKILENSQCNILFREPNSKVISLKDDYLEFCDEKISEINNYILNNFNKDEIEVEVLDYGNQVFLNVIDKNNNEVIGQYDCNLYENMANEFVETVNLEKKHLGSEAIYKSYLLQPIKEEGDIGVGIVVQATIYPSSQVIIRYSIKLKNTNSWNFTSRPDVVTENLNVHIPKYIIEKNDGFEYTTDILNVDIAIGLYNDYIQALVGKNNITNVDSFEVTVIGEYEGMPKHFDSMEKYVKEGFFFFVNRPYGIINRQTEAIYDDFIDTRYDINKYSAIFASTKNRILIAYNEQFNEVEEFVKNNDISNLEKQHIDKCNAANNYVLPIIKLLLINKSFYKSIDSTIYTDNCDLKYIMKIQNELLEFRDYNFFYLKNAYGTVKECYGYLENKVKDFFPKEVLNEKLELYTSIIAANESIRKEENNHKVAFFATVVTILFGTESIDKFLIFVKPNILNLMYSNLGKDNAENIIKILTDIKRNIPIVKNMNIAFLLWLILLSFVIRIFYKDGIYAIRSNFRLKNRHGINKKNINK